jgi:hypothetical protein
MTDTEARDALAEALHGVDAVYRDDTEAERDEYGDLPTVWDTDAMADAILAALDGWTLVPVDTVADAEALAALPEEAYAYWYDDQGDVPKTWCVRLSSIQRDRKVYCGPTLAAAVRAALGASDDE